MSAPCCDILCGNPIFRKMGRVSKAENSQDVQNLSFFLFLFILYCDTWHGIYAYSRVSNFNILHTVAIVSCTCLSSGPPFCILVEILGRLYKSDFAWFLPSPVSRACCFNFVLVGNVWKHACMLLLLLFPTCWLCFAWLGWCFGLSAGADHLFMRGFDSLEVAWLLFLRRSTRCFVRVFSSSLARLSCHLVRVVLALGSGGLHRRGPPARKAKR